jgi:hypothetical protein
MPDEFDGVAAAQSLASLVRATSDAVRPSLPPAAPAPLFKLAPDGSIVNRKERAIRGPIAPLAPKVT